MILVGCTAPGAERAPSAPASASAARAVPEALRADAARRAGVPVERVALVERQSVTWRDGALGCPQPDRGYTQALVPGYRIRVRAGETLLTYHADRAGRWLWCPPERASEPLDSGN
jgi:hypothetical protein